MLSEAILAVGGAWMGDWVVQRYIGAADSFCTSKEPDRWQHPDLQLPNEPLLPFIKTSRGVHPYRNIPLVTSSMLSVNIVSSRGSGTIGPEEFCVAIVLNAETPQIIIVGTNPERTDCGLLALPLNVGSDLSIEQTLRYFP